MERIFSKYMRLKLRQISEVEAKEILEAYGFRILPGALASEIGDAVAVAERIGYPVVMKVVSPDIIHKSDLGGVQINLGSAEQVRDAYEPDHDPGQTQRPGRLHPRRVCGKDGATQPGGDSRSRRSRTPRSE